MPEHIRALIVIMGLSVMALAASRQLLVPGMLSLADFVRRRNLWLAITLIAFLSGNFWIYSFLAGLLLLLGSQAESNRIAMFLTLIMAVPPAGAEIPGLGLMEHLFELNHLRLLALTLLLPMYLRLVGNSNHLRFGTTVPDRLLVAYLALSFAVMLFTTTFTNAVRHGLFLAFLDVFLPYYVASRSLRNLADLRDAMGGFLVASIVASVIAVFETAKGWLLYSAVVGALDVHWGYSQYLGRAFFGLRAQGATGQPIALGYVLAIALLLSLHAQSLIATAMARRLLVAILAAGLFASLSRGPWLGAVAGILVFVATGGGAGRTLARYAVVAVVLVPVLREVPGLQGVIELLPFVGSAEAENLDYRRRLIDVALDAVWERPLFGGIDIYQAKGSESLLQHHGTFIDLVNTYIGVLLTSGLVGLSLFCGFFAAVLRGVWRQTRAAAADCETRLIGRTLLAALGATLFIIMTVSSITVIPTVYWALAGLSVAFTVRHEPSRAGANRAIAARADRQVSKSAGAIF
jgi:O-antigen ligase